jgi:UDP-N-acetylmuramoyl-L-alanyl-D-glutamate--2,6-diaminopimelate ligase
MEATTAPGKALAIVDYAHTPDALAKSLRAARAHCRGKLHLVFGCGGDRDTGKRPLMAGVAAAMADAIVITDDNPRSESAAGIAADIIAGFPQGIRAAVIHDRAEAIRSALASAREGDVVLVAGKGHENYQIVGAERRPFSDRALIHSIYGTSDASAR